MYVWAGTLDVLERVPGTLSRRGISLFPKYRYERKFPISLLGNFDLRGLDAYDPVWWLRTGRLISSALRALAAPRWHRRARVDRPGAVLSPCLCPAAPPIVWAAVEPCVTLRGTARGEMSWNILTCRCVHERIRPYYPSDTAVAKALAHSRSAVSPDHTLVVLSIHVE